MQNFKQEGNRIHRHFHLPVTWLISSILFFVIASVVAPVFWTQLNQVDTKTEISSLHFILGLSGIIVYILEPIIWHNNVYGETGKKSEQVKSQTANKKTGWFSFFSDMLLLSAELVLIRFPAMILSIFKPVFRALILFVSLSFLNLGSGNLGEYPLFVIPVIADVLLYYLDMIAPNWKYNPVRALVRVIKIKNKRIAIYTSNVLLIIHSALIYSFLLTLVYYDIKNHPEDLNIKTLALWWLILTVYSRLSFLSDEIEISEILRSIPQRVLFINLLALIISFVGFIWPFYFG